jgi:rod shape-determining protein MreC
VARWFKPAFALFLLSYLVVQVLSINFKEKKTLKPVERIIVFIAAPVQNAVWTTVEAMVDGWRHYIALTQTSKLNDKLQKERAELTRKLNEQNEVVRENERLRQLLELRDKSKFRVVVAERMASGASTFEKTLRVSLRDSEPIRPGLAVLHPGGVLGQVIEVSPYFCDVLLLTDLNSAVDGIVQRSRARTLVKGTGTSELKLEYLSSKDDVAVGDEVVTSGLDGIYPEGIPIGVVSKVETGAKGLFKGAWLKPHFDFSRAEEVEIILQPEKR